MAPKRGGVLTSHLTAAGPRPTNELNGWSGINETTSGCGCLPADPTIAVGTSDVVEMTNGAFYMYDKSGNVIVNGSLNSFFVLGTDFVGEPRVIYDNLSGFWFAAVVDLTTNNWSLGISASSNPDGPWTVYGPIPPVANQYPANPTLGVSDFMVAVGLTDYNISNGVQSSEPIVFNKTQMEAASSVNIYDWGNAWVPNFAATVSLTPSPTQYFAIVIPATPYYTTWNVTGAPPATPTFAEADLSFGGPAATPVAAGQFGTANTLAAGDGGIISSYEQNGLVTSSWDAYYSVSATDIVRVDQSWPSNSTLWQDFGLYSGGVDLLYPAVGIDSRGDFSLLTSYSGTSYYPGLISWGQAGNEPGSIASGAVVPVGGTTYLSGVSYWGSYQGATVDPTSTEIWAVGDYMSTLNAYWSTYIVGLQTDPVSVVVSSAPGAIDLGQPVTFSATAAGGTAGYSYSWTSLPTGCTNSGSDNVSCTPSAAGTFPVTVTANDTYPTYVSASTSFTVNPAPTLGAVTASRAGADVGQSVTFTSATAAGGTPGFTYAWAGLPAGCGSPTTVAVACTFTASGSLSLVVTATDSVGGHATGATFDYTVSPALAVGTPTATPASVNTGTSVTLAVTATGGSGGDTYAWAGLPNGCSSSNAATITCAPSKTGSYSVSVTVTDSNGASATSAKVALTVTSAPATSGLFGLSGSTGWIIVGVIVAVVVLLALVLMMRRRKPAAAPQSWQAGPPSGASGGPPPGAGESPPPPPPPT